MANYIKLEWWNECDLGNIYYSGGFKNKVYFETEIGKPDYVIEQETKNNQQGVDIILSSVRKKIYQFEVYVPEYMVDALVDMALHDNIHITYTNGLYSSAVRNVQVIPNWEDISNDCMATVTIKFQQDDQLVDNACCATLPIYECLEPCLTVRGFKDDHTNDWILNEYYIKSLTSATIQQYKCLDQLDPCQTFGFVDVACANNYVFSLQNSYFGIEMYFDGTQWYEAPEILTSTCSLALGNATITIKGFALPNTFVKLYYSTDNITFVLIEDPITAAEFFTSGFQTVLVDGPTYYFKVYMYNHNCQYQYSDVLTFATCSKCHSPSVC